jgi:hypothetical protein
MPNFGGKMAKINYYILFSLVSILLFFSGVNQSKARPVSYPTGWTVMQMNDANMSSLHVHYSPTANYSIGYKSEYHRDDEIYFNGLQLNILAKRWNKPQSQANFYIKSGIGAAYSDFEQFDGESSPAVFTGIALDWEDRRYFTSYENRFNYMGDIDKHFMQKARLGIAPYIGDYGDLHTWVMLEVDHMPERDSSEIIYTPMLRFFKDVYLFEVGVTSEKDLLFNSVIRF